MCCDDVSIPEVGGQTAVTDSSNKAARAASNTNTLIPQSEASSLHVYYTVVILCMLLVTAVSGVVHICWYYNDWYE